MSSYNCNRTLILKINLTFNTQFTTMSKDEIKYEISKVLDNFSDKALAELLAFLKEFDNGKESITSNTTLLNRILLEDKDLLIKLAL